jgi:predicted dehydrogenase
MMQSAATYHPAGSQVGQVWTPGFFDDAARSFAATTERHLDVFVQALLEGRQVPIPAREGYEALLLAEAAIVSENGARSRWMRMTNTCISGT